jgi:GNAT superfamily N-acetyltransferase
MISDNTMKGYLAYHREQPVGWCNVNSRECFQRMIQYEHLIEPSRDKIVSMVCFLVHPGYRRIGIATRLLDRIEADYRSLRFDWLEAYPGKGARSQEEHYTGPPSMFLSRGFHIVKESADHYLVRKSLH